MINDMIKQISVARDAATAQLNKKRKLQDDFKECKYAYFQNDGFKNSLQTLNEEIEEYTEVLNILTRLQERSTLSYGNRNFLYSLSYMQNFMQTYNGEVIMVTDRRNSI